jgi:hypothetical protein
MSRSLRRFDGARPIRVGERHVRHEDDRVRGVQLEYLDRSGRARQSKETEGDRAADFFACKGVRVDEQLGSTVTQLHGAR